MVVLINGIVFKGRTQLVSFIGAALTALGVALVESSGLLPPGRPPLINLNPVVNSLFLLGFSALVLFVMTRNLGETLTRARSNEEATRALLDDLVDTSISRSYLDNVLSSLSDSLIVLNTSLQIERVNPATLALLGYVQADLIGHPVDMILTPDALHWLERSQQQIVTSVETQYLARDGREVPVSFSGSLLYGGDLSVQGIVCVAQDISERQRAAQQLRQRDELYRTLARNLPGMAIILCDRDCNIMIAEGRTLTDYGYESAAVEGQPVALLEPVVSEAEIEGLCRRALEGEHLKLETRYGEDVLDVEVLPVMNEADDIFAALVLLHNVTDTKLIEAELMHRVEQLTTLRKVDAELSRSLSSDYVLSMALDIVMRTGSAETGAILIYRDKLKVAIAYGDHLAERLNHEIHQAMLDRIAVNQDNYMIVPLISMQRPLGAVVLSCKRSFTEAAFNFVQILAARIAVALDNAQLYEMSVDQLAESRQLYERVSELEQLKTDMIRIAAHDLRNPLNIVSGFAEILLENEDFPQQQRDQIQHIFRASQRMQNLVVDILSLDRIERLQEGGYDSSVDLVQLVASTYKTYEIKAEKHDYQLVVPDQPIDVLGDEPQLREAVSNLIGNALKYTPEGGSVMVRLQVVENQAVFEVVDTGYGITKDAQARLFEPFYRVKDKETRHVEGTGLGLHLVKNIVERHNGHMFVESVHGEGSTFGFRLDIAEAQSDTNDETELVAT